MMGRGRTVRKTAVEDVPALQEKGEAVGHLMRGKALFEESRFKEALIQFKKATEHLDGPGADPRLMVDALVHISRTRTELGELDKAEAEALRAMELVRRPGMTADLKGMANYVLALALLRRGELDRFLKTMERAASLLETAKDWRVLGDAYRNIGNYYLLKSVYGKALAYYNKALGIFRDHGIEKSVHLTINNLAMVKGLQGNRDEAIKDLGLVLEWSRRVGDIRSEYVSLTNIGYFTLLAGRWGEAIGHIDAALGFRERIPIVRLFAYNMIYKSEALLGLRDIDGADAIMSKHFRSFMATKSGDIMGQALRVRGMVFRERGELKKSEDDFALGEGKLKEGGHEVDRASLYIEWAKTALKMGDERKARELFGRAREIFGRLKLSVLQGELENETRRCGLD